MSKDWLKFEIDRPSPETEAKITKWLRSANKGFVDETDIILPTVIDGGVRFPAIDGFLVELSCNLHAELQKRLDMNAEYKAASEDDRLSIEKETRTDVITFLANGVSRVIETSTYGDGPEEMLWAPTSSVTPASMLQLIRDLGPELATYFVREIQMDFRHVVIGGDSMDRERRDKYLELQKRGYARRGAELPVETLLGIIAVQAIKKFILEKTGGKTKAMRKDGTLEREAAKIPGALEFVQEELKGDTALRDIFAISGPPEIKDPAFIKSAEAWTAYQKAVLELVSLTARSDSKDTDGAIFFTKDACCQSCKDIGEAGAPHHPGCICGRMQSERNMNDLREVVDFAELEDDDGDDEDNRVADKKSH